MIYSIVLLVCLNNQCSMAMEQGNNFYRSYQSCSNSALQIEKYILEKMPEGTKVESQCVIWGSSKKV
jgi:hypothetical protein